MGHILKRLWCIFSGHGPMKIQEFEQDCGDETLFGYWKTCKKCSKSWEIVLRSERNL